MASGRSRSSKDSDSSGSGWMALLAGAAGAAIVAGASAYGGYKLRQRIEKEEEEKCKQDQAACVSHDKKSLVDEERNRAKSSAHTNDQHSVGSTEPKDFEELSLLGSGDIEELPLHDQLLSYYHSYVKVTPDMQKRGRRVMLDVVLDIDKKLEERNHVFKWNYLTLRALGSDMEATQVISSENFDFNMIFDLDKKVWELADCAADKCLSKYPGQFNIRRINHSSCRYDFYDGCTIDGRLSPTRFSDCIVKALREEKFAVGKKYKINISERDGRVLVSVNYGKGEMVYLNMYPSAQFNTAEEEDVDVVPSSLPWWLKNNKNQEQDLLFWRRSYGQREYGILMHANIPSQCLQIMKSIRMNDPQLTMLDTYIYKTVLFHLMESEDEWHEAALAERFLDFLKLLETYLQSKHLPHYFEPQVNLLEGIDEPFLQGLLQYIGKILGQEQLKILLQYRH